MKTQKDRPTQFEFYVRDLDNLIQVESSDHGVVVRASRDNFTERRKYNFIRILAAEGFIPDELQWFATFGSTGGRGVRWIIDASWIRPSEEARRISGKFMRRFLAGSIALWLVLMTGAVVLGGRRQATPPTSVNPPALTGAATADPSASR